MKEKIFSCAKFNLDALLSHAGALRCRTCTCDTSAAPKKGGFNWAIFILFDDGVEWVFRSPRTGLYATVSDESSQKMLISEATTLRFLRSNSAVPVPEVFSFNGSHDNPIGVPYILMSRAAGRPLSDYDWAERSRQTPGYPLLRPLLPMFDQNREKVMKHLGTIMAKLSVLHFDKIGSLFESPDGSYVVGECLSPALVWQERDSLEEIERGPFLSEDQYLHSLVSAFTAHVTQLPITPHAFFAPIPDYTEYSTWASYRAAVGRWNDFVAIGAKIESSKNRLSYSLAGQFLQEMIPHLSTSSRQFTLSHPDLHAGNIFVDEDFNITCIIDWGSASTGPITELLAAPGLGNSAHPPSERFARAFRSGFGPVYQQRSEHWEQADMMWYFSKLVRLLSIQDYRLFQALYKLVYKAERDETDIARLFHERAAECNNQQLLATLRVDDYTESEIKQKEDAAFGSPKNDTSDSRAVARKLTLISELNHGFLTDSKLWRWIEQALDSGGYNG